jgi:hypothetical protein
VRRRWIAIVFVALAVTGVVSAPSAGARDVDLGAFGGLGTWVDVYDYVPGFPADGGPPPVTVDAIDDMASLGVRTLYLQAAQDDSRIAGNTVPPKLLGSFLRRAHDRGMRVVAWYVPKFYDQAADLRRIRAIHDFRRGGERFDAIALDLEWTQGVPDAGVRNAVLLKVVKRARSIVGDTALGAIVLEPILLDDVNRNYWPAFPWKKLHDSFDAWLPMSYWTNRNTASGFRDGFKYTSENIRRVRRHLDDDDAIVHVIGGIANDAAPADYDGFVRAAKRGDAVGWSVYDFNTTTSAVWARLKRN